MNEFNIDNLESLLESLPPGHERDKVSTLLGELKEFRENNPLYFYNHPELNDRPVHKKQIEFHSLDTAAKFFFGGNQSGKTTAGLADDCIQALPARILPEHLLPFKKFDPPFHCRILAPSLQVLELTIYVKLQELLPKSEYLKGTWNSSFDKQLRVLRLKCGSSFQFMTYEQDWQKMGGVTIHRVHYDEEPPRKHRIENRLRVMRYGGDEVFTMTPVEGLTWMNDEIWENRGEEVRTGVYFNEKENFSCVTVDMDDNPYLGTQEKVLALAGLSDEEREARKSGRFVALTGLIYKDFNERDNILPYEEFLDASGEFQFPQNFNVISGIDPGLRNRCAVLFSFIDAEDNIFVFDELYEQGKTVREVATEFHKLLTHYGATPIYNVIDPASRNKNHQTGRSDQSEYADHGILTIPGQNAVETGINRVRERFQNKRLYILSNCVNLIREVKKYRWKEAPRTGEDGRPVPVKKDDHALDALRYIVMSRPYTPTVRKHLNETQLQKAMRLDMERFQDSSPRSKFGAIYD